MYKLSRALWSLLLATAFSFILPVLLLAGVWSSAKLILQIPDIAWIGRTGTHDLRIVLAALGSGNALEGLLVIGLAFGFVGALFDGFTLYRQRQYHDVQSDYE